MTGARRLLLLLLLLGLPGVVEAQSGNEEAICATPAVFLCENFEDRPVETFYEQSGVGVIGTINQPKYKNNGWAPSQTRMFIVASPTANGGQRGMQWTYGGGINNGAGFYEQNFPPASGSNPNGGPKSDVYLRFYVRIPSNFPLGCANGPHPSGNCTTKMVQMSASATSQPPIHLYHLQAQITNRETASHIALVNSTVRQNVNGVVSPIRDVFQCIEYHVRLNTAIGVANGLVEGWIDGVQHHNHPNLELWSTGTWSPLNILQFTASGSGNDYGGGTTRQVDNIILSTQRIGCIGGAPPPPPANSFTLALAGAGYTTTGAVATLTQLAGPTQVGFIHTALLTLMIVAVLRRRARRAHDVDG